MMQISVQLLALSLAGQLILTTTSGHLCDAQNASTSSSSSSSSSISAGIASSAARAEAHSSHGFEVNEQTSGSLASSLLRAYIRTNNMRAYHLDLHSYRAEDQFTGDAAHLDSENLAHQKRCHRQLGHYHHLLETFAKMDPMNESVPIDAIQLADLFGRPPAGLLEGNQFWLGSHDSCLDHKLKMNDELAVISQYCLGLTQFPSWNARDTKTSIKVGLCLPETCTNSMLNNIQTLDLVEQMMKFQFGFNSPFQKLKLRSIYCLPHETSSIRQFSLSAKLLIALLATFVLLATYATIYDNLNNKIERETSEIASKREILTPRKRSIKIILVEAFSLNRNIEKLMQVNASKEDQQVSVGSFDREAFSSSITGLKCIGLLLIIAAHTFLVSPIPSNNLISIDKLTSTILANIYLTAHLMVDTFFALSGLLASYLLFKSGIGQVKRTQWIVLTIHRYWRLTPVYLISYWFTKSLGHLLGSGPLWDYATAEQSPRFRCQQESWTEALLHLSDFKSPKEHCVPFAWFIANGIKFWLVTPFILTAIHHSMRRGYQITCALILANMMLVYQLAFSSNVDMKSVIEFKPESAENMLNNMDQVYTRPYSRIGAYLVGLLAGHLFYLIDTKQIEVKLSKNVQILLWTIFSITTIVMIFLLKLANNMPLDDAAIPHIFGISSALIRPLWAVCSCWLVFALAHGQARWLARFLSGNVWKILVKLSFSAYLTQGEVIAHLYLGQTHSNAFTYVDLITRPIVAIALTLLASIILLLLVEYPLIGIEELVLPAKKKHSNPTCQEIGNKTTATTTTGQQVSDTSEQNKLKVS